MSFGGFGRSTTTGFGTGGGTFGQATPGGTPGGGFGAGTGFGASTQQSTGFGATSAFGQQPATGGGFGASTTASPFGQQSTATGFGTAQKPAFGAQTPAFGGGGSTGFGSGGTTGGFGSTLGGATPGATTGFGGGGGTTTGGLFGSPGPAGGTSKGFGGTATPAFGAGGSTGGAFGQQPTGGTFGAAGSAFGATPSATGGGFGGGATGGFGGGASTGFGGGLGGAATTTSPWGAGVGAARAPQPGTGNPPYKPVQHHDNNSNMPVYIQAITAMDAFKEKSFEELRWEDYQRGNNKGTGAGLSPLGQAGGLGLGGGSPFGGGLGSTATGGGLGGFGGATSTPGAFGGTTSTFGGTATPAGGGFGFGSAAKPAGTFGAASSTTPGAFGSTSTTPLFGQTPGLGGGAGTTGGFGSALGGGAFGAPAPAPAPSPFGAPAAAPSPFGAPATSAFGSTTLGGTFGAPSAGTTTTSPFGATTGGFGATAAKTPSPAGFGGFGTPASTSAFGTPAPSLGGAATGLKPFGSTFGAPTPAPAPAPGVGLGGFGTPAPAPAGGFGGFGATTTQTPSFSTGAFGAKPAASTATSTPAPSFSFATPSTFGPGGIGSTTQVAAPTGTTGGFLGGFGGFGGTPAPAPAPSSFGASTPFASPSFSLGGQTMQSALGGQTPAPAGFGAGAFATPAQQAGQAAQFYTPQTGGLPVLPDQRPLQILVSGSGGKRGSVGRGLRSEGLETTPPALQSYRHTPRSAAKILPRGLRSLGAGAGAGAGGAGDDGYYASIVSPGSDSFAGRGPKHLDIGAADDEDNVFAAESKVLDLDDVRRLQEREQQQQQQQQARPSPPPAPAAMHYPPAQPSPQQMGRGGVGVEEAKASVSSRRGLGLAPTLTRPGYFTTPPLEDLREMTAQELRRVVGFAVTREGVGRIQWEGETDVAGLDLDAVVAIDPKQVRVYEDVARKDPEGTKLNKPAVVTLFSVRHKRKAPEEYARYLEEVTASWDGARFVSYDTETGRWVFEVAHFSKYGVADDDDDSDNDDDDGGLENRAGAANQRRQPPPLPPPAEGKGAAYGVADSDGESESEEGGIVMVAEKDWQGAPEDEEGEERGAETRPPEEELELPPVRSRRLSGGAAYGLEQGGRVRTLANIFGEDEEEAREREAEEAQAARRFDENLAWGRRQQQQPPLVWGSEAMEEDADLLAPPVPKPPRVPKPPAAAFTFVDPELTRGLGAVGNTTASGAAAGVPELFRPKMPASAAVQGARRKPVDYCVFMGRSFRVAWGPHGTLALPVLRPAPHDACKVERALAVKPLPAARSGAAADPQALVGPLGVHKAFSLQVAPGTATAAPRFALLQEAAAADGGQRDAVALYWHLVHCLQSLAKEAGERDEELACQAWELVNALWGQEGRGKERPLPLGGSLAAIGDALLRARGGANHNDWERRRQAVGRWLKRAVRQESERTLLKASGDEAADLQAVLNLMKSHRLEEAAELAADAGFLRLATLIPLAGHRPFTALIDSQPALRRGLQDRALADIYALLGGCREGPAGDPGLDWLRALGAYLWFTTEDMPTGAAAGGGPVPMDRLVAAIQEFNDRRPAPPLPAWLRARYEAGGVTAIAQQHDARRGPNSVLYDLLQLYRTERHPLALLLDPRGLTENELDYRLPWLLMTLLRALGLLDGGAEVEAEVARVWQHVASGLVYQLVGAGLWQWAVYVLLHGPDGGGGGGEMGDKDKCGPLFTTLVRELVGRHAWDPTHWAFLEGMGVPHAWLEEARAAYLRSAGILFWDGPGADGLGEDDALGRALAAGDWRAGTELVLNVVAPRLLTGDRGAQVLRMLNRLAAAGPPGKEGVGGALELAARTCREYTQFCDDLGAGRWAEAEQRLAALLPHLVHGGGGGGGGGSHDKGGNCFTWRADRLGPEEAGLRRSMYDQGEEKGEGEEDATTTPPALRAIRDMVLTDVVTKCFFFHSFNASAEAGTVAGGLKSVFPRRSQLCRVDEMMGDYAVKQVNTLLSNYTMVHLDGGEV